MVGVLVLVPVCFACGLALGPWMIRKLTELRFGKQIRLEGQEHHLAKAGTPTMGGLLFVVVALAAIGLFVGETRVVLPLVMGIVLFAAFGAYDDLANMKSTEGLGLPVRAQLLIQMLMALLIAWTIFGVSGVSSQRVPLLGSVDLGMWMVPFAALVILATSSGANLIDGLDGLAAGTVAFAFVAVLVLALRREDPAVGAACAAMVGALLAYLWFNVHPAQVFMGGVGSLPLGAALAVTALLLGEGLLLIVIAAPLVIDVVSVILQVAYFKATGGKRLFRRAPIHHGFELAGVSEVRIVFRFWLFAALAAIAGLIVAEL